MKLIEGREKFIMNMDATSKIRRSIIIIRNQLINYLYFYQYIVNGDETIDIGISDFFFLFSFFFQL